MKNLEQLAKQAKREFDLTKASDQESLYNLAEEILELDIPQAEIEAVAEKPETALEFRIAAKLVESKRFLNTVTKPLKIGIVFAMWGEHNRLKPKTEDNPNGEDSLRVKLEQIAWATNNSPLDWTLYAVDDGDPHNSGALAQEIASSHPLGRHVKVLHLADAVPTDSGPLKKLASADDSRKGGAIIYGAQKAIEDGCEVVIYTDADNSVHLGQIGLLLKPYLEEGIQAVWGDRKNPKAVLVKQEARWGIGIVLLRHMQRMIGQAIFSQGISDTQAAFKLYSSKILKDIIADPAVYDFSFDSDWILAVIAKNEKFAKVPFAFIDSAAESASIAQGPMTTWETLLKGLLKSVRKHNIPHNLEMAKVLDEEILSSKDLDLLINHLPAQLENTDAGKIGDPELMSPAEIRAWIKQRKAAATDEI